MTALTPAQDTLASPRQEIEPAFIESLYPAFDEDNELTDLGIA